MSQRDSGYERKERDLYETPEWVTEALLPHLPCRLMEIIEPACASGKMARVLERSFLKVTSSDIADGTDFLNCGRDGWRGISDNGWRGIITNPPYVLAQEFCSHAIALMQPDGLVAMLLRTDFDHAKTRHFLFGGCPPFSKKVILTKRIRWFEDSKGSPSFNHAWFIWDWQHQGAPTLAYGP